MLEQVYDTLKGILFHELPKNSNNIPHVYDRPITGWYFGDRTPIPNTPAIIFQGQSSTPKDIAFGVREIEHNIKISLFTSNDDPDITERVILEMTRLVHEAL